MGPGRGNGVAMGKRSATSIGAERDYGSQRWRWDGSDWAPIGPATGEPAIRTETDAAPVETLAHMTVYHGMKMTAELLEDRLVLRREGRAAKVRGAELEIPLDALAGVQ